MDFFPWQSWKYKLSGDFAKDYLLNQLNFKILNSNTRIWYDPKWISRLKPYCIGVQESK